MLDPNKKLNFQSSSLVRINEQFYEINVNEIIIKIQNIFSNNNLVKCSAIRDVFKVSKEKETINPTLGFSLVQKHRFSDFIKSKRSEDVMMKITSFKGKNETKDESKIDYFRSFNIEGNISKSDDPTKYFPTEILHENFMFGGYPTCLNTIFIYK